MRRTTTKMTAALLDQRGTLSRAPHRRRDARSRTPGGSCKGRIRRRSSSTTSPRYIGLSEVFVCFKLAPLSRLGAIRSVERSSIPEPTRAWSRLGVLIEGAHGGFAVSFSPLFVFTVWRLLPRVSRTTVLCLRNFRKWPEEPRRQCHKRVHLKNFLQNGVDQSLNRVTIPNQGMQAFMANAPWLVLERNLLHVVLNVKFRGSKRQKSTL